MYLRISTHSFLLFCNCITIGFHVFYHVLNFLLLPFLFHFFLFFFFVFLVLLYSIYLSYHFSYYAAKISKFCLSLTMLPSYVFVLLNFNSFFRFRLCQFVVIFVFSCTCLICLCEICLLLEKGAFDLGA